MNDKNITRQKTMDFAVKIVKLCNRLKDGKKEFNMSNQLFRSGTSIGANYCEAQNGASKKDFLNKVIIALKEARETEYWLELLYKTEYLDGQEYQSIIKDCDEILSILAAITKKVKADIT